jgi:hypothetical protein
MGREIGTYCTPFTEQQKQLPDKADGALKVCNNFDFQVTWKKGLQNNYYNLSTKYQGENFLINDESI